MRFIRACAGVAVVAFVRDCTGSSDARADARPPANEGEEVRAADAATTAELARRWEGSWVVRGAEAPGSIEAWTVRDRRVSVYDARRGQLGDEDFALVSPCRIQRTRVVDAARGEASVTIDTFVFAPDGLLVAPPTAGGGVKRGTLVTACIGDDVYTYETETRTCRRWNASMDDELTGIAECQIMPESAASAFVWRPLGGGAAVDLDIVGDALVSPGLQPVEPQPSAEAARARADELARSRRSSQ